MARIKIDMPDNYLFSTTLDVRESRVRFLRQYGYTELDVEGLGIIMTDSAIVYKAEGFYGDQVQVDITVGDFNKYGCDIFYLMTNKATAVEIAHVKTGIVFFDYEARKVVTLPEGFRANLLKDA
jgi:acyl-CoA thioester hydrolase